MTTIVFGHRPRAVVLRQVAGIIFLRLVLIILLRPFLGLVLLLLRQLQKWKASAGAGCDSDLVLQRGAAGGSRRSITPTARTRTDACTHPSLYFRSGRMR